MTRAAGIACLFVCVLVTAGALAPGARAQASGPEIVVAQDNSIGGFFRRLFRPRDNAPQGPRPEQRWFQPSSPQQQQPAQRRSAPASPSPSPREIAAVQKNDDAKRVLVVGDFLASALAKGLALAYQDNPGVLVIDATSGSSGLVRNDYYDWPAKLPGIAKEQTPDAILVMIGGNDRQGIDTDSGPYALGTDGWRAAYAARVNALVDGARATGKPVLWVGLVPVQSSTMSRDYSTFNGIVREQLEAKNVPFVEVWNGFADDQGKYTAYGPDVNGQAVQLRASDGLNFTRAGQRKLAYFVEQDLESIFGGTAPQLSAVSPSAAGKAGPKIGPMVPLDALAASGGDALASPSEEEKSGSTTLAISKQLAGDETIPPERADSYAWPPPEPPAPSAPPDTGAAAPPAN